MAKNSLPIQQLPSGRWQARYRVKTSDGKVPQRKATFDSFAEAQAFLEGLRTDTRRGVRVEPARGLETVGAWLDRVPTAHLKASTAARYRGALVGHLRPRWADTLLTDVRTSDIQAWLDGLTSVPRARKDGKPSPVRPLSASSKRTVLLVLSLALGAAQADRALALNPCRGVKLAPVQRREPKFMTAADIRALARVAGIECAVLGFTGIRWSELVALRVADIDVRARRLNIRRAAPEVDGVVVEGTPKSHHKRRVPVPTFLVSMLAEHIEGRPGSSLAFGDGEHYLRSSNWRTRQFTPACESLGLIGVTPHDLRHTAASLMIASGANVKKVQQSLGHESAAVTLDIYADLWPDDLDDLADAMEVYAPRLRPVPEPDAPLVRPIAPADHSAAS